MRRRMKTAGLVLVAAFAWASAAEAAVVDTRSVKLTSTGYDFGGSAWAAGAPVGSGEIHYHHDDGRIRPHLLGTLHLNDADGTCGRMRMQYFDADGDELRTEHGGEKCVTDDQHHSWSVDLDPYEDDDIASVRVAVQKETVSGWSTTESSTYDLYLHPDRVEITEDGVDFGGREFAFGEPNDSYDDYWWIPGIWWHFDGSVITPELQGTIHLNNSSGVCARMNLRYMTEGGAFLIARHGNSVCADDNGHHAWTVELLPYSSSKIGQVKVQLQTLGNDDKWRVAGSKTVALAE